MLMGRCSREMFIPEKLKNPRKGQHRDENAVNDNILQMMLLHSSWKVTLTWLRRGGLELELKKRFVPAAVKVSWVGW